MQLVNYNEDTGCYYSVPPAWMDKQLRSIEVNYGEVIPLGDTTLQKLSDTMKRVHIVEKPVYCLCNDGIGFTIILVP